MHRRFSQSGNKRLCRSGNVTQSDVAILVLGVEVMETSTRECECCRRHGIPTSGCRSFRGLPSWKATCSATGVPHIQGRWNYSGDGGLMVVVVGNDGNFAPPPLYCFH
ncbi:hypothetical protein ISCGN_025310 [Ixodes scapularis]